MDKPVCKTWQLAGVDLCQIQQYCHRSTAVVIFWVYSCKNFCMSFCQGKVFQDPWLNIVSTDFWGSNYELMPSFSEHTDLPWRLCWVSRTAWRKTLEAAMGSTLWYYTCSVFLYIHAMPYRGHHSGLVEPCAAQY